MSADPHAIPEAEEVTQPFYIAAHDSLVDEPPRILKHGDTFALFDHYGDLASRRGNTLGLYHRDTRFLSRLKLTIERRSPLLLSSTVRTNNAVLDVDLTNPDIQVGETLVLAKDTIHVTRMKFLWNAACYEMLLARNFGEQTHTLRVDFDFDADFADLFEVRGLQAPKPRQSHGQHALARRRAISHTPRKTGCARHGSAISIRCRRSSRRAMQPFELELPPKQRRSITMSVHCLVGDEKPERRVLHALRSATRELRAATRRAAAIETSSSLANEVLCRSMADISMLVTDTEHGPYPYAGVPWFSTAFGRDGIITAMQLLWLYPGMARGVLRYLAACQAQHEDPAQGRRARQDPARDAQVRARLVRRGALRPLLRLHRFDAAVRGARRPVLAVHRRSRHARCDLAERQGGARVDRPLRRRRRRWLRGISPAPRHRAREPGLEGFRRRRLPRRRPPRQRAHRAVRSAGLRVSRTYAGGAHGRSARRGTRSPRGSRNRRGCCANKFEAQFWDDELGMYVLALDGDKKPCRVRTSNAGQLLFTGIARADRAAIMAHDAGVRATS